MTVKGLGRFPNVAMKIVDKKIIINQDMSRQIVKHFFGYKVRGHKSLPESYGGRVKRRTSEMDRTNEAHDQKLVAKNI